MWVEILQDCKRDQFKSEVYQYVVTCSPQELGKYGDGAIQLKCNYSVLSKC